MAVANFQPSSNPKSIKYGQHYSAKEVHEIFAPAQTTVDTVRDWLIDTGIENSRISQSVNKQWLQLDATAAEVENLLQTKYYHYEHLMTGKSNIGCEA